MELGHTRNDAAPDGLAFNHVPSDGSDVARGQKFKGLADKFMRFKCRLRDVTIRFFRSRDMISEER